MNCQYCQKRFVDSMSGLVELTFHEIMCIREGKKAGQDWRDGLE